MAQGLATTYGQRSGSLRPAVLKAETVEKLLPYLGFRHFFRHSYTFEIDWEKVKPLAVNARAVLEVFKDDLKRFLDKLGAAE